MKSSRRKPLRDVSNNNINFNNPKSTHKKENNNINININKNIMDDKIATSPEVDDPLDLDRLLLVHSDVSSLLRQIDELVIQAVNLKTIDEGKTRTEIKSFTNVLSEIHSSLTPWVPRLQKALAASPAKSVTETETRLSEKSGTVQEEEEEEEEDAVETPEHMKLDEDMLVSPSPLVSWRAAADCTIERGKQLFLLTPLPMPRTAMSKLPASCKSVACNDVKISSTAPVPSFCSKTVVSKIDKAEVVVESVVSSSDLGFASPPKGSGLGDVSTALVTPSLKMQPLTSCMLLEPECEIVNRKFDKLHKSTPFPVRNKVYESTDSESSSGDVSAKLGLKYLELIGIKPSGMLRSEVKALEASPAWMMSPPKCCTLLEPTHERPVINNAPVPCNYEELVSNGDQEISVAPPMACGIMSINPPQADKKFPSQGVESTPLWNGCESTVKRGKRPGENTLKRELWTRFEAASFGGFQLSSCPVEDASEKGFLDRLEEVSSDEATPLPNIKR